MAQTLISWKAFEYEYRRKTADWYWAVWIIVVSIAVTAILLNDILLAVLVIVASATLTMLARRPPKMVDYRVTSEGVQVRNTFYPFDTLDSFYVEEMEGFPSKLLIKSRKLFMTLLIIPLGTPATGGIGPDEVRAVLDPHIIRERLSEPLSQKFMEFIGF